MKAQLRIMLTLRSPPNIDSFPESYLGFFIAQCNARIQQSKSAALFLPNPRIFFTA